jgi:hypothetical protein
MIFIIGDFMRNIGFDEYLSVLNDDGLPEDHLSIIKQILNEIPGSDRSFPPKRGSLVAIAVRHSKTYQTLGEKQSFIEGVLNMPIFFMVE